MSEKEKQEYMDNLYSSILRMAESDNDNDIMLECMVKNYQSKINLGWPSSIFQNGY